MYFIKIIYRGPALNSLMLDYQLKTCEKSKIENSYDMQRVLYFSKQSLGQTLTPLAGFLHFFQFYYCQKYVIVSRNKSCNKPWVSFEILHTIAYLMHYKINQQWPHYIQESSETPQNFTFRPYGINVQSSLKRLFSCFLTKEM